MVMKFCHRDAELDDVISHALDQGYTVELRKSDAGGYHVHIDGVAITKRQDVERNWGLPHENFQAKIPGNVSEAAEHLIERIKKNIVLDYKEDIDESDSSPVFVKRLREYGLWGEDLVDWTDFEDRSAQKAAILQAELEEPQHSYNR